MQNNSIVNVLDPFNDQDVATKHYVDSSEVGNYVNKAGDTMTGDLTFNGTSRNVSLLASNIDSGKNFL